jgi:hypothetical protein
MANSEKNKMKILILLNPLILGEITIAKTLPKAPIDPKSTEAILR